VEYYKDLIALMLIAVPYLIFVWGTHIDKSRATLNRAIFSIIIGWVLVVISSFVITGVDLLLAQTEYQSNRVTDGVVDRHIFALLLGWVFPALIVFLAWLSHLGLNKIRRRWFHGLSLKRF